MDSLNAASLADSRLRDAARSRLKEALREEGEALASACEASNTLGAASVEACRALRSAQSAHTRSGVAAGAMRALDAQANGGDASPLPLAASYPFPGRVAS